MVSVDAAGVGLGYVAGLYEVGFGFWSGEVWGVFGGERSSDAERGDWGVVSGGLGFSSNVCSELRSGDAHGPEGGVWGAGGGFGADQDSGFGGGSSSSSSSSGGNFGGSRNDMDDEIPF